MSCSAEVLEQLLEHAGRTDLARFKRAALPPIPRIAAVVSKLWRPSANEVELESIAFELMSELVFALASKRVSPSAARCRSDASRIHDAIEHIERNIADDLSLDSLSARAHLSPFHFLRLFRARTGMTPRQYVIQTRLRRAVTLLRETLARDRDRLRCRLWRPVELHPHLSTGVGRFASNVSSPLSKIRQVSAPRRRYL
jgi:AraC-like DNA-binding protein